MRSRASHHGTVRPPEAPPPAGDPTARSEKVVISILEGMTIHQGPPGGLRGVVWNLFRDLSSDSDTAGEEIYEIAMSSRCSPGCRTSATGSTSAANWG